MSCEYLLTGNGWPDGSRIWYEGWYAHFILPEYVRPQRGRRTGRASRGITTGKPARPSAAANSILAEQTVFEALYFGKDARLHFFSAIQSGTCQAE